MMQINDFYYNKNNTPQKLQWNRHNASYDTGSSGSTGSNEARSPTSPRNNGPDYRNYQNYQNPENNIYSSNRSYRNSNSNHYQHHHQQHQQQQPFTDPAIVSSSFRNENAVKYSKNTVFMQPDSPTYTPDKNYQYQQVQNHHHHHLPNRINTTSPTTNFQDINTNFSPKYSASFNFNFETFASSILPSKTDKLVFELGFYTNKELIKSVADNNSEKFVAFSTTDQVLKRDHLEEIKPILEEYIQNLIEQKVNSKLLDSSIYKMQRNAHINSDCLNVFDDDRKKSCSSRLTDIFKAATSLDGLKNIFESLSHGIENMYYVIQQNLNNPSNELILEARRRLKNLRFRFDYHFGFSQAIVDDVMSENGSNENLKYYYRKTENFEVKVKIFIDF